MGRGEHCTDRERCLCDGSSKTKQVNEIKSLDCSDKCYRYLYTTVWGQYDLFIKKIILLFSKGTFDNKPKVKVKT